MGIAHKFTVIVDVENYDYQDHELVTKVNEDIKNAIAEGLYEYSKHYNAKQENPKIYYETLVIG